MIKISGHDEKIMGSEKYIAYLLDSVVVNEGLTGLEDPREKG